MFDLFDELGVKASCTTNAVTFERRKATTGRIMNVGLHPHVSGRAHRIRALREFIEHAKSMPGVWWATREEIAYRYLQNHESHIPGQLG